MTAALTIFLVVSKPLSCWGDSVPRAAPERGTGRPRPGQPGEHVGARPQRRSRLPERAPLS